MNNASSFQVSLPRFGSLCSRFAKAIGIEPLALASEKQRLWARAAEEALGTLSTGGAFTEGYHFMAYDERWSTAALNLLFSSGAERYGKPSGESVAHSMAMPATQFPPTSLRAVGASRETKRAAPFVEELSAALGSSLDARVFVVAHEFAHAWQSAHGFVHIRQVVQKISKESTMAQEIMSIIDSYGASSPTKEDQRSPPHLCRILLEESVADAIGCWVLARRGAKNPFLAVSKVRDKAQREEGMDLAHYSSWLLAFIDARHPTLANKDFRHFVAELTSIIALRAPQIIKIFESQARPIAESPKPHRRF